MLARCAMKLRDMSEVARRRQQAREKLLQRTYRTGSSCVVLQISQETESWIRIQEASSRSLLVIGSSVQNRWGKTTRSAARESSQSHQTPSSFLVLLASFRGVHQVTEHLKQASLQELHSGWQPLSHLFQLYSRFVSFRFFSATEYNCSTIVTTL